MDDKTLRLRTIGVLKLSVAYLAHASEAGLMQDCVTTPQKALAVVIGLLREYDASWSQSYVADLSRDEAMPMDDIMNVATERIAALEAENRGLLDELEEARRELSLTRGALTFLSATLPAAPSGAHATLDTGGRERE